MQSFLKKCARCMRTQPVLCITLLVTIITACVVPPSRAYIGHIDWRVLGLLFSMMLCVEGIRSAGLFKYVTRVLLSKQLGLRVTVLCLVLLSFFISMFATNDVALIAFVPFALYLFRKIGRNKDAAFVVVLQTLAANLGSMLTPFGNPQNLFLYTQHDLRFGDFISCIAPFSAISLAGLCICCVIFFKHEQLYASLEMPLRESQVLSDRDSDLEGIDLRKIIDSKKLILFTLLFALSILAVLKLIPVYIACLVCLGFACVFDRKSLSRVNYSLLATFVCFFIVSGNLADIEMLRSSLESLMARAPFFVSLATSQIISNVPTAVLLDPFTSNWKALLLGVDIGGLGTPVASLASLISLEFYSCSRMGSTARYLKLFAIANVGFLALTIAFGIMFGLL